MDLAFQGTIDFGGLGRITTELVRALAGHCESITVYPTAHSVSDPASHKWWTKMPSNVSLVDQKGPIQSYVRDIIQFRNHDVAHINFASIGSAAAVAKVLSDTPYVYTIHGYGPPLEMVQKWSTRLQYFLDLKICLPIIGRYGTVATISEFNKTLLKRQTGLSPTVIPHGIRPERYRRNEDSSVRDEYDIDIESQILLFVGRFHKYKDVQTLLAAFANVCERYNNPLELVLLGGGPNETRVRRRVQQYGIADNVTFVANVSDTVLANFYNEATIFTFPSYGERFGLVYLEAMAAGLPIIYAEDGSAPEVVGDTGIGVEPRNAEEFADAIVATLKDTERQEMLSDRSRKRVSEFSWESAASQYAELYSDLIENS